LGLLREVRIHSLQQHCQLGFGRATVLADLDHQNLANASAPGRVVSTYRNALQSQSPEKLSVLVGSALQNRSQEMLMASS
jgi:hypothetical protein